MKIKQLTEPELLFKKFCDGYKYRDLAYLLSIFSKNITVWGTGVDEYRSGLKEIETQLTRDWSQSDEGEIRIMSFASTADDSLWTSAVCKAKIVMAGQDYVFEHLRCSLVIEQEDEVWKIAHMHSSFPDFRNTTNRSFPLVID